MSTLAETIIATHTVQDAGGKSIPLHSHTSAKQGKFLQGFIEQAHVSTALEVGLAYGVSALFACEALAKKSNPRFISIDLAQDADPWSGIGRANVKRAGFGGFAEFLDGDARNILPKLAAAGERIDFAYLDGSKVFDVVLVNASFTINMLRPGGFIAFDDCGYPGIRAVVRYLARWPHLKVAGLHEPWPRSAKRRALVTIAKKTYMGDRIFRDDLIETDAELGVDGNCVVFQKIKEDERSWDWGIVP